MYHLLAALTCLLGSLASVLALWGERRKWRSFLSFSVGTKVPVEIFCVSGPVVMVTVFLYLFLGFLLATERGTNSVFYIASAWSVVFLDMCVVMHHSWKDVMHQPVDMILHVVDLIVTVYSFWKLPFFPYTYLLSGSGFWGLVVLLRMFKKARDKQNPRLPDLNGDDYVG